MRVNVPLLRPALLVAALLLAGCAEQPAATGSAPEEAVTITAIDDVDSLTNMTFTNESHLHDYWGGKEHLVVLEETASTGTFFFSEAWSHAFLPESGHVVPQGTSRVSVTMTWTDSPTDTHTAPELWVQTPADHEPVLMGELQKDVPIEFPTTLEDADTPHQLLSRWRFEFRLHPGPAGLIWYGGDVTIRVEAHRGLEIPVFPPHPDLWNGFETLPLLDEEKPFGIWRGNAEGGWNCFGDCPRVFRPDNGSIVPWDAALVEVRLTPGSDSATSTGLKYHGADTRDWTALEPTSTEGDTKVYQIPVTPLSGDGPYAAQSQWELLPYVDGPQEDDLHAASYHIAAIVLKDA